MYMSVFLPLSIFFTVITCSFDCDAPILYSHPQRHSLIPSWCRYKNILQRSEDVPRFLYNENLTQSYTGWEKHEVRVNATEFGFNSEPDANLTTAGEKIYTCSGEKHDDECLYVTHFAAAEFDEGSRYLFTLTVDGVLQVVNLRNELANVFDTLFFNVEFLVVEKLEPGYAIVVVANSTMLFWYKFKKLMGSGQIQRVHVEEIVMSDEEVSRVVRNVRFLKAASGENLFVFNYFVRQKNDEFHSVEFLEYEESGISVRATWKITNFTRSVNIHVFGHYYDFNNGETDTFLVSEVAENSLDYVIMNDLFTVHVICLTRNMQNIEFSFETEQNVDGLDVSQHQMTLLYDRREIDENELVNVLPLLHRMRHLDFWSTCGSFDDIGDNQAIGIIVVSSNGENSYVDIIEIHEFEQTSFIVADNFGKMNPLNRNVLCSNVNNYFEVGEISCSERETYSIVIEKDQIDVSLIQTAFNGPISSTYDAQPRIEFDHLCDIYFNQVAKNKKVINQCASFDITNYTCDFEVLQRNEHIRNLVFKALFYHNIFIGSNLKNKMYVLSFGPTLHPLTNMPKYPYSHYLKKNYEFQTDGKVENLYVSPNSFHVIASVRRNKWELDSQRRRYELCAIIQHKNGFRQLEKTVRNDDQKDMLQVTKDTCREHPPSDVSVFDFIVFQSSCKTQMYCPYFQSSFIEMIPSRFFALTPLQKSICPAGYYCVNGEIIECPPGYFCSGGNEYPRQCQPDDLWYRTCFVKGTSVPDGNPCPPGSLCVTVYGMPVAVPPGYRSNMTGYTEFLEIYDDHVNETRNLNVVNTTDSDLFDVSHDEIDGVGANQSDVYGSLVRNHFYECQLGDWCVLGIFFENLCPQGTFCVNASVLLPQQCLYESPSSEIPNGFSEFCPDGTYEKSKVGRACPAGNYCRVVTKNECSKHFYCPVGSLFYMPCPGGFFCPSPKEKKLCPLFHYCPEGSIMPKRCTPLSICPPGTEKDQINMLGIVGILVILGSLYLIVRVYSRIREVRRRTLARKMKNIKQEITQENENEKFIEIEVPQQGKCPVIEERMVEIELPDAANENAREERIKIDFGFIDLKLELISNGYHVLRGVTGEIKAGEVTAVMGLSGCGKSTFITTLADRAFYGNREGKILINGCEQKNMSNLNKFIGFVPQEDVMCRRATVEENISYSAYTRLDKRMSKNEIREKVERVIEILSLDDVRHSIIGDENVRGISGGQRKRVNIGIELVTDPVVLFLDEPTSGLDSSSSQTVCDALRNIAVEMKIPVICVIHQPRYEIFESFEKLLLLGKPGKDSTRGNVVYLGPTSEVEEYFKNLGFTLGDRVNPADFMMDCLDGRVLDKDNKKWTQEDFFREWEEEPQDVYVERDARVRRHVRTQIKRLNESVERSWLIQFREVLKRSVVLKFRDLKGLMVDLALILVGGCFLGIIFANEMYIGSLPKVISDDCPELIRGKCEAPVADPLLKHSSLICLILGLSGLMAALNTFGREKAVFVRESSSGLKMFPTFIGKNLPDLINIVIAPCVFLGVYYGVKAPRGKFMSYFSILVLFHWASYGLGYFMSFLFTPQTSKIAGVVLILVMFLFCGLSPTVRKMSSWIPPVNFIPWMVYLRFVTESLYLIEIIRIHDHQDTNVGMLYLGYRVSDLWFCVPLIFLWGVIFRVLAYFLMNASVDMSYYNQFKRFLNSQWMKVRKFFEGKMLELLKEFEEKLKKLYKKISQTTYTVWSKDTERKQQMKNVIEERDKEEYPENDSIFGFLGKGILRMQKEIVVLLKRWIRPNVIIIRDPNGANAAIDVHVPDTTPDTFKFVICYCVKKVDQWLLKIFRKMTQTKVILIRDPTRQNEDAVPIELDDQPSDITFLRAVDQWLVGIFRKITRTKVIISRDPARDDIVVIEQHDLPSDTFFRVVKSFFRMKWRMMREYLMDATRPNYIFWRDPESGVVDETISHLDEYDDTLSGSFVAFVQEVKDKLKYCYMRMTTTQYIISRDPAKVREEQKKNTRVSKIRKTKRNDKCNECDGGFTNRQVEEIESHASDLVDTHLVLEAIKQKEQTQTPNVEMRQEIIVPDVNEEEIVNEQDEIVVESFHQSSTSTAPFMLARDRNEDVSEFSMVIRYEHSVVIRPMKMKKKRRKRKRKSKMQK